jgi:uroporphyrinogen-III synthase
VDAAIRRLREHDWAVFTSANAVRIWMDRLSALRLDAREFEGVRVAAIGPATADELARRGVRADLVPPRYVAESVLEELLAEDVRGRRYLLPRAAEARPLLAVGLREAGALVTELALYTTAGEGGDPREVVGMLERGELDAVTFTSSSTVRNLLARLPEGRAQDLLARARVVCIGPVTGATARELGLRVDAEAAEHTLPGLVRALKRELAR